MKHYVAPLAGLLACDRKLLLHPVLRAFGGQAALNNGPACERCCSTRHPLLAPSHASHHHPFISQFNLFHDAKLLQFSLLCAAQLALRAFGFPVCKADVAALLQQATPDSDERVDFDRFRAALAAKLTNQPADEPARRAFRLMDGSGRVCHDAGCCRLWRFACSAPPRGDVRGERC